MSAVCRTCANYRTTVCYSFRQYDADENDDDAGYEDINPPDDGAEKTSAPSRRKCPRCRFGSNTGDTCYGCGARLR